MHIVRMWRMRPIPDAQLTLVSSFSRATYSGMLPGSIAGLYTVDEMEIDLRRLALATGVRLIVDQVVGLDTVHRRVLFRDRPPVHFDVASIGIGSVPAEHDAWKDNEAVLSIKPMATFRDRLEQRLQARRQTGHAAPIRIAVVGAGAAGTEVTLCLQALLRERGTAAQLSLLDAGPTILNGYAAATIRLARKELQRRGVAVLTNRRVTAWCDGQLLGEDNSRVVTDLVIWATAAAPPEVLENFELPKADDGFLAVRPTLQTTADAPVFVVGDTATIVDSPVPKAGVYAVREGPILWENLQRTIRGEPLVEYRPQKTFLSLLATGDSRAIGEYKGCAVHGHWVWKWKDHLDRKFMRLHRDYRPMASMNGSTRSRTRRTAADEPAAMKCRGCGGKVGASVLTAALSRLDLPTSPYVESGLHQPDDAAVLAATGAADVVSMDFFQAFLDDPYLVGRIAALNALSDLWATGATPIGGLAAASIPDGPERHQQELLYQLLAGGVRELTATGASLLGGHTTEADELMVGYTVFGRLNGLPPFRKGNLTVGDRLVLTKPLGTGVLLAAYMRAQCRAPWMDAMLESMLHSNAVAARAARRAECTAVTDITGFGLAGHLFEMLTAGGVAASVSLPSVPLLVGYHQLSNDGVCSSLDASNRGGEPAIRPEQEGLRQTAGYHALFDPQTSGGLLIAVRPQAAHELVRMLHAGGVTAACIVGSVLERTDDPYLRITA